MRRSRPPNSLGLEDTARGRRTHAEDLLLRDLHRRLDVGEDGRLDEVALGAVALAAEVDRRALVLAGLDVRRDAVVLELGRERALERVGLERTADLDRLDLGRELLEELVVDRLLDEDARAGAAALTTAGGGTESGSATAQRERRAREAGEEDERRGLSGEERRDAPRARREREGRTR